jgi:hypothetical protein
LYRAGLHSAAKALAVGILRVDDDPLDSGKYPQWIVFFGPAHNGLRWLAFKPVPEFLERSKIALQALIEEGVG